MNTRVKLLRTQLKLSQEAFGKKLGVTAAGISKIESGQRSLTEQMILLICREFHINENWLRYSKGEMYREKLSSGMEQLADHYSLDDLDIKIVNEFLALDEKKRKVIKDFILKVASASRNDDILVDGNGNQEVLRCAEGPDADEVVPGLKYGKDLV